MNATSGVESDSSLPSVADLIDLCAIIPSQRWTVRDGLEIRTRDETDCPGCILANVIVGYDLKVYMNPWVALAQAFGNGLKAHDYAFQDAISQFVNVADNNFNPTRFPDELTFMELRERLLWTLGIIK